MCARPSRHLYRGDAPVSPKQGLELAVHVTGKSAGCPAFLLQGRGASLLSKIDFSPQRHRGHREDGFLLWR